MHLWEWLCLRFCLYRAIVLEAQWERARLVIQPIDEQPCDRISEAFSVTTVINTTHKWGGKNLLDFATSFCRYRDLKTGKQILCMRRIRITRKKTNQNYSLWIQFSVHRQSWVLLFLLVTPVIHSKDCPAAVWIENYSSNSYTTSVVKLTSLCPRDGLVTAWLTPAGFTSAIKHMNIKSWWVRGAMNGSSGDSRNRARRLRTEVGRENLEEVSKKLRAF